MRDHDTKIQELISTGFSSPNFTTIPNDFFRLAKLLKEGELRIMLVLMRKTYGWGDKEWDRISLSQLMFESGMAKKAVSIAISSLCEKGLVHKAQKMIEKVTYNWYSLHAKKPTSLSKDNQFSNNLDRYPKDTGGSILKIHTKETLTKYKKKVGNKVTLPCCASHAPPPTSSSKKEKIKPQNRVLELTSQEKKEAFSLMGDKFLVDKYTQNAVNHFTKCPDSYKELTFFDVVKMFYQKDQDKKTKFKKPTEKQVMGKAEDGKILVRETLKLNPHLSEAIERFDKTVIIGKGNAITELNYWDPSLRKELEKMLQKIKRAFGIDYKMPEDKKLTQSAQDE